MRNVSIGACLILLVLCVPPGCGSEVQTGEPAAGGSGGAVGQGGLGGAAEGGGGSFVLMPQSCPDGELAQTMDGDGNLICTTIDEAVRNAVNRHCHLFYGWRDSCDGCSSDPAKLGRTNGVTCNNISGGDNSCAPALLGETALPMFGLNTDGDVNGDDKFYVSMYCEAFDTTHKAAPCEADELLAGIDEDGQISCVSLAGLVTDYLRNDCGLHLGWRDSCNGCADAPAKHGYVNATSCSDNAGADNTCKIITVGDWDINIFGINTDGNVNGDDKFYLGWSCADLPMNEEGALATGSCPDGMAMTGITADGQLMCESPLFDFAPVLQNDCWLYHGWRDDCGGCSSPPAKWGRVSQNACELGAGADNSCLNDVDLGNGPAQLLGINPDGDVDGNDKFYLGMRCEPPSAPPTP